MLTISIEDKWADTLRLFGDVDQVVNQALRAYFIEQCQQRIDQVSAKIAVYNQKYHRDYHNFKHSIQTDEDFLVKVEAQNPLWEEDAMEWEYWLEEQQTWQDRFVDYLREDNYL